MRKVRKVKCGKEIIYFKIISKYQFLASREKLIIAGLIISFNCIYLTYNTLKHRREKKNHCVRHVVCSERNQQANEIMNLV